MTRLAAALALALALAACAGRPEPPPLDAAGHARLTLDGFRAASPEVARRIDAASALAVFPDLDPLAERAVVEGRLWAAGAPPRPVLLALPPGATTSPCHLLVLLSEPPARELERRGALDLFDVPVLDPHDRAHLVPWPDARVVVVTSAREHLLFDTGTLAASLRLVPARDPGEGRGARP